MTDGMHQADKDAQHNALRSFRDAVAPATRDAVYRLEKAIADAKGPSPERMTPSDDGTIAFHWPSMLAWVDREGVWYANGPPNGWEIKTIDWIVKRLLRRSEAT